VHLKMVAAKTLSGIIRKQARESGLKRYFTGNPCKHGHVAERFVSSGGCVACAIERLAVYDIEKRHLYAKRSKAKNKDKVLAYNREYNRRMRAAHGTELNERRKFLYQQSAERRARVYESVKRRRQKNPSQHQAEVRRWQERYPEKYRELSAKSRTNRRARKLGAPGKYTTKDVREIVGKQKGRCAGCGKRLGDKYEVDHIQPLSRGGSNDPSNLQALCTPCNRHKSFRDPIVWAREQGRLL
jgi:5-methylcytosine-specific restriction endonuclease McrA